MIATDVGQSRRVNGPPGMCRLPLGAFSAPIAIYAPEDGYAILAGLNNSEHHAAMTLLIYRFSKPPQYASRLHTSEPLIPATVGALVEHDAANSFDIGMIAV